MIKQLENFAGDHELRDLSRCISPPRRSIRLWRIQEASPLLYKICLANPFTYAVELIRFAFYGQVEWISLGVVAGCHAAVPGRRHHRLRPFARPDDPQTGHGRKRLMARTSLARSLVVGCHARADRERRLRRPRIRTGPASSARCRNCRSARSGTGRTFLRRRRTGRRITAVSALVEEVAARRVPIADAQKQIRDFAASLPAGQVAPKMAMLVQGMFDHMDAERSQVISGIARYAHKQLELAAGLRKEASDVDALRAKPDADPDEIERRTDQLNWATRIFEERVQSLTYVCEVPTIIEQRLYQLSKTVSETLAAKK